MKVTNYRQELKNIKEGQKAKKMKFEEEPNDIVVKQTPAMRGHQNKDVQE